ncbi:MAG: cupredoxin domain-containing protein [Solirubrobacterales bacterium]
MRKLFAITAALAAVTALTFASVALATTKSVSVRDNSYSKSSITIHKNDTISFKWKNTGNKHTVTTSSGPSSFSSKLKRGNYSYSHKFTKSGTYSLFCKRHPDTMKLKVTVKKS